MLENHVLYTSFIIRCPQQLPHIVMVLLLHQLELQQLLQAWILNENSRLVSMLQGTSALHIESVLYARCQCGHVVRVVTRAMGQRCGQLLVPCLHMHMNSYFCLIIRTCHVKLLIYSCWNAIAILLSACAMLT